jgi:putative phosphoribosyl transferase
MRFADRHEAGRQLGCLIAHRWPNAVVLALPRGGVPVGEEVAAALEAPLEVLVARKLGAPRNAEVGYGAIAEGGGTWLDPELVRQVGVRPGQIERALGRERQELARRVHAYRGERPLPDLGGKVAVLVDDGIATGSTARAALRSLHQLAPARVVLAVPVMPADRVPAFRREVDEVVAVEMAERLESVGEYYADFAPTSDREVAECLARARRRQGAVPSPPV